MQQNVNLTIEQMDLLKEMSINEEKVERGDLSPWQWEVVNQFNFAKVYLQGKYPDYEFSFTKCFPKNQMNSQTSFIFTNKDNSKLFDMYMDVIEGENGNSYEAIDNFYGYILKSKVEDYLFGLIKDEFDGICAISSTIKEAKGREYDQNISIDDIKSKKLAISINTKLYMKIDSSDEKELEQITEKIKKLIGENKMYGKYYIYFYSNIPENIISANDFNELNVKNIFNKSYVYNKKFVCAD